MSQRPERAAAKKRKVEPSEQSEQSEQSDTSESVSDYEALDVNEEEEDLKVEKEASSNLSPEERLQLIRKVIGDELFGDKFWLKTPDGSGGYRGFMVAPLFEEDNMECLLGYVPVGIKKEEFAEELKKIVKAGLWALEGKDEKT